jgi:hypothetical protein
MEKAVVSSVREDIGQSICGQVTPDTSATKTKRLVEGDTSDDGKAFGENGANEGNERCRIMEVKNRLRVEMCYELGVSRWHE